MVVQTTATQVFDGLPEGRDDRIPPCIVFGNASRSGIRWRCACTGRSGRWRGRWATCAVRTVVSDRGHDAGPAGGPPPSAHQGAIDQSG